MFLNLLDNTHVICTLCEGLLLYHIPFKYLHNIQILHSHHLSFRANLPILQYWFHFFSRCEDKVVIFLSSSWKLQNVLDLVISPQSFSEKTKYR